MPLEKVSLFTTKRDFLLFLFVCGFIFIYSLLIEYNNYKNLTRFDSNIITATVIKQYSKTKINKKGKTKHYQVLKLKSNKGASFYITKNEKFPPSQGQKLELEIWAGKISFYEYMTSFFAYSKVISTNETPLLKQNLNSHLTLTHNDKNISHIYKALYTATSLPSHLQTKFSTLGISHLFAISGFHLGVLSTLLFFLFKTPYKFFQNKYFPFRSYKVDSFLSISSILFLYLLFLDTPPSLLRAFVMLLIGFILYDRGFKVVTMTTLFLTVILILSFSPRLFFSLGFWLSIFGVFYIFLFLIHFKNLNKVWQFMFVPIWVYLMMLPLSLFIFENFSLYHPVSIVWTSLFTLFYPLSILFHLLGFGSIFDTYLVWILNLSVEKNLITIPIEQIATFLLLSLASVWKKSFAYLLLIFALFIFVYSIYNVA